MSEYKDCLISFDEDGNAYYVSIYCFKSKDGALRFWKSIMISYPSSQMLMHPIMILHDGNKEDSDRLTELFQHIYSEEK